MSCQAFNLLLRSLLPGDSLGVLWTQKKEMTLVFTRHFQEILTCILDQAGSGNQICVKSHLRGRNLMLNSGSHIQRPNGARCLSRTTLLFLGHSLKVRLGYFYKYSGLPTKTGLFLFALACELPKFLVEKRRSGLWRICLGKRC